MPKPHDTAATIAGQPAGSSFGMRRRSNLVAYLFGLVFLCATFALAHADTGFQNLIYVAAIFSILAISLDLVAGMLGLYSLGQGGFFAIGAYLTTIAATTYEWNIFLLLPAVLIVTAVTGGAVGAMSLRVSGLYFAITTFIFTLVLTVLATNLQITGGLQGLLGPLFPDFPDALAFLGTALSWCIMGGLLICITLVWSIRQSPFYPVVLSIRDAEPFAESAGVRTSVVKITMFSLSAAMAGGAGWLFSFLGVVSPGQFDWSVSLNVLVMILIGGINTTIGPLIGAAFVTMFPAVVNINPWIQEVLYGALSILFVTMLPEGVVGALRRMWRARFAAPGPASAAAAPAHTVAPAKTVKTGNDGSPMIECRDITFTYGGGLKVLRGVNLSVKRGQIHGLIGPNGSGKSTLANIVSGRLKPTTGSIHIKGEAATTLPASARSKLGFRRTFQAAELVQEISTTQNVMVGLYDRVRNVNARIPLWPFLPSAARDQAWMEGRAHATMDMVGAGSWSNRPVHDVPHGIEQLTQLAAVSVAEPDIIVLDEPATGLSPREVEHLAEIISTLKVNGTTVVIIEHQTKFLFPLCDEVTVLNAGEVILTGTPDEVRSNKTVRQVYLGDE